MKEFFKILLCLLILFTGSAISKEKNDKDMDGILDEIDLCPEDAEIINGLNDDDGCPDTIFIRLKGKILKDSSETSSSTVYLSNPSGEAISFDVKGDSFDFVTNVPGIYKLTVKSENCASPAFYLYLQRGQVLNLIIPLKCSL
jgi:hypothetical protein